MPTTSQQRDTRPRIPAAIARKILFEAAYRCAVCGEGCPLEKAHITPWSKCKEHKAENLICLCANCHERADKEEWGEEVLLGYKRTPWVHRRFDPEIKSKRRSRVDIKIAMNYDNYTKEQERLLCFGIAAFLGIDPAAVEVMAVKPGSVNVTLYIPSQCQSTLMRAVEAHDENLFQYLDPLSVVKVTSGHGWALSKLVRIFQAFGRSMTKPQVVGDFDPSNVSQTTTVQMSGAAKGFFDSCGVILIRAIQVSFCGLIFLATTLPFYGALSRPFPLERSTMFDPPPMFKDSRSPLQTYFGPRGTSVGLGDFSGTVELADSSMSPICIGMLPLTRHSIDLISRGAPQLVLLPNESGRSDFAIVIVPEPETVSLFTLVLLAGFLLGHNNVRARR